MEESGAVLATIEPGMAAPPDPHAVRMFRSDRIPDGLPLTGGATTLRTRSNETAVCEFLVPAARSNRDRVAPIGESGPGTSATGPTGEHIGMVISGAGPVSYWGSRYRRRSNEAGPLPWRSGVPCGAAELRRNILWIDRAARYLLRPLEHCPVIIGSTFAQMHPPGAGFREL